MTDGASQLELDGERLKEFEVTINGEEECFDVPLPG